VSLRNIELKARLRNRTRAEAACAGLNAAPQGNLRQVDTYFHTPRGRLKLREQSPGRNELIFYLRPDRAEARGCDYWLAPAAPETKALLAQALGLRCVVAKMRTLYLWENVRIHLDEVAGLGDFIEFEAVLDENHGEEDGLHKLRHLCDAFGIRPEDRCALSYLELLESA
jgi:adenylate cyclase class IV